MHLRRALLLFALVLGLTALAASIAPPPRSDPEPAPPPPAPQAGEGTAGETATLSFRAPPARGKLPERKVATDDHVIVEVSAAEPGQATIPRLGRTASVTETVPARFNVLAPPPGSYDVMFEAVGQESRRIGSIVTER